MRDLQGQLESQIQNEIALVADFKAQLTKERDQRLALEAHSADHQLRGELSDLLLAKEDLERLIESLIRKVLASCSPLEASSLQHSSSELLGGSRRTNNSQKKKTSAEVLRGVQLDLKEMGEVCRELTSLVAGILLERQALTRQVEEERELRSAVERVRHQTEGLSGDMLLLKLALVEEQFRGLEQLWQANEGGAQLFRELERFSMEFVDEKLRLVERARVSEEQNAQMQKDLETLIFRIEELEAQGAAKA